MNNLELAASDNERAWLPLSPTVDNDFFLRSGAVIQDELIHGSLSDWDRDLSWRWNDSADDDILDDEDDNASDDELLLMDHASRRDDESPTPAPAVTHTPLVRRKMRPDASASGPTPATNDLKRQRRNDE